MAQLATVLDHDGLLIRAVGGPKWNTTVYPGSTGLEKRNGVWGSPRHEWSVTFGGLYTEMADLLALHEEAEGQKFSFLWSPPGYAQGDFRFASDELQIDVRGTDTTMVATVAFTLIEVIGE